MMDLIKNLVGCLIAGVLIFGAAIFREIEVEGQSAGSAVAVGLVAGGGVATILSLLVVVFWRRERDSASDPGEP